MKVQRTCHPQLRGFLPVLLTHQVAGGSRAFVEHVVTARGQLREGTNVRRQRQWWPPWRHLRSSCCPFLVDATQGVRRPKINRLMCSCLGKEVALDQLQAQHLADPDHSAQRPLHYSPYIFINYCIFNQCLRYDHNQVRPLRCQTTMSDPRHCRPPHQ